jgi:hypothetical protein
MLIFIARGLRVSDDTWVLEVGYAYKHASAVFANRFASNGLSLVDDWQSGGWLSDL